jgi:Ran GTPase-activating protein (RanGAP) involved in mRNA processing and transport
MNTEQQFVDLIKEGKVADAMQLIKTALTEMAGVSIVQTKFDVAEACGMKKSMKEEDMEDEEDEDDEMKEKKKGMEAEGKKMEDEDDEMKEKKKMKK